jgi:hypothetical protein
MKFNKKIPYTIFAVLIGGSLLFGSLAQAEEQSPSVKELKGAFILNFIKFVRFENEPKSFTACVVKDRQVFDFLNKNAPKTIADKTLNVKFSDSDSDSYSCNVVYIANGKQLEARKDTLIITDQSGGGVIELMLQDDKLVFGINSIKAQSANLSFPSQVMSLAVQLSSLSNNEYFFEQFIDNQQSNSSNFAYNTSRNVYGDSDVYRLSRVG